MGRRPEIRDIMALWRICVLPLPDKADPHGRQTCRFLHDFGFPSISAVRASRLFFLEINSSPHADESLVRRAAARLLSDPVVECFELTRAGHVPPDPPGAMVVEVHLRPGVMDTVAQSTALALADLGIEALSVRTARRYEIRPIPSEMDQARICRLLGNPCIEEIVRGAKPVLPAPAPPIADQAPRGAPLRDLGDADLERLSRRGHLFLALSELHAIQHHFRTLGRDPTDLELETLAQTWSEHCVHKTLKSTITYVGAPFPTQSSASGSVPRRAAPPDGPQADAAAATTTLRYENLLRDTIGRATRELMDRRRGPQCLSVFSDNAGVIAFDDQLGIAFKVETHNHPSAIEPYGGAATGVGGVIRDILGCGLGAKPIANTDLFCVAPPDWPVECVPKGVIHPRAILRGVVAGVRDYGNRMGIPTVNGAVCFDPRYLGNPLVFCGCVGLIPRNRITKGARPSDLILLLGGRTGRDGIHGATFSSAELTESHEDEFAHAVQIGNAIEEKKLLDVILRARSYDTADAPAESPNSEISNLKSQILRGRCLFSAITDCGAGGLSSAVGEMAARCGAEVHLEKVPLKYSGLRYDEIWISESQERMVLAVPPETVDTLLAVARGEDVEATVIGRFTDSRRLVVEYEGAVVGDLDLAFLHEGLPKAEKTAEWRPAGGGGHVPDTLAAHRARSGRRPRRPGDTSDLRPGETSDLRPGETSDRPPSAVLPSKADPNHRPRDSRRSRECLDELFRRLADPNTASKHWIIRQYDHEVQGRTVVRPLTGPRDGPADAAVLRPRLDSDRGIAIGCGLAPRLADLDPYWMAAASIDEAIRNVVCVGGDPRQTAILDNFCWPAADDPLSLGALVRAAQACYDVATAYATPFISGKDSLNNVFAMNEADWQMVGDVIARQYPDAPPSSNGSAAGARRLSIPYTLLISAVSIVSDVRRCITSAPRPIDGAAELFYVGVQSARWEDADFANLARLHAAIADLIRSGTVLSAHDCSDGGVATAVAEMAIGSGLSVELRIVETGLLADPFAIPTSGYVVQAASQKALATVTDIPGMIACHLARLSAAAVAAFTFIEAQSTGGERATVSLADLERAWKAPLDW